MTASEASLFLLNYFESNTFFQLDDLKSLLVVTDKIEQTKSAITAALVLLEKRGLIIKINENNQDKWVLVKPLHQTYQTVQISQATANLIIQTIYSLMADCPDLQGTHFSALDVDDNDISIVIGTLLDMVSGEEGDDSEDSNEP